MYKNDKEDSLMAVDDNVEDEDVIDARVEGDRYEGGKVAKKLVSDKISSYAVRAGAGSQTFPAWTGRTVNTSVD